MEFQCHNLQGYSTHTHSPDLPYDIDYPAMHTVLKLQVGNESVFSAKTKQMQQSQSFYVHLLSPVHPTSMCTPTPCPEVSGIAKVCFTSALHHVLVHLGFTAHKAAVRLAKHLCAVCTGLDFSSFDSLEDAQAAAKQALEEHAPDQDGSKSASLRNIDSAASTGQVLAECFETAVESTLQQPTFVLDFPLEISPLAKPHRTKPGLVERFELYIAGDCLTSHCIF